MNITFVTGNSNKIREAERILETTIDHFSADLDEIQSLDLTVVADHKVMQAWGLLKKPVFVMDQSIYIRCLNDFPGPLIKWFWEQVTLHKICDIVNNFDDKIIRTETTISFFDGTDIHHFTGQITGTIPKEPRGTKGWGWDPIFIPDGYKLTYGEMEPDQVLALRSHTIALQHLKDFVN